MSLQLLGDSRKGDAVSKWYNLLKPVLLHFRTKRAEDIKSRFPDINKLAVLDLGGSFISGMRIGDILSPASVTIINIEGDTQSIGADAPEEERARIIVYDGKNIPYADKSVELLICNSVIEHVPPEARAGLAAEIERVAQRYVVQTPAYEFPIEPISSCRSFTGCPGSSRAASRGSRRSRYSTAGNMPRTCSTR
ncbi:MAG: methyltransferase domain-containing protein [Sphingomonas sp.]